MVYALQSFSAVRVFPLLQNTFKIFCLVATAAITLATSESQPKPSVSYLVASNCPGAIQQERIEVSEYFINNPTGRDFQHYGLPVSFMSIGAAPGIAGMVNGIERSCTYSLQQQPSTLHLYTCFENGVQVCQVSFEPAQ